MDGVKASFAKVKLKHRAAWFEQCPVPMGFLDNYIGVYGILAGFCRDFGDPLSTMGISVKSEGGRFVWLNHFISFVSPKQ